MDDPEQRLAEARRRGDPDRLAEALMAHANALVLEGKLAEARHELDEAVAIYKDRARTVAEASCLHLAATLCRALEDLDGAEQRAERAVRLAPLGTPTMVAAWTELGEISMARRRGHQAAHAYQEALDEGAEAGLVESARGALLRKKAMALAAMGDYREAAFELVLAREALEKANDTAGAIRARIEEATAWEAAGIGEEEEAARARREAEEAATAAGDLQAQADLALLAATHAIAQGDLEHAIAAARRARQLALAAVAPVSFVGAAVAISGLADNLGDRLEAYSALASGWATLGDLMGGEIAEATFAPKLLELRNHWGAEVFLQVKQAYEERRREPMEGGTPD